MTARTCGWCDQPSVDEVITVPGRKNRRAAPVCAEHKKAFIEAGQTTVLHELEVKESKAENRPTWVRR